MKNIKIIDLELIFLNVILILKFEQVMASAADVPASAVESEDDDEEPAIISSATAIKYISSPRNFLNYRGRQ